MKYDKIEVDTVVCLLCGAKVSIDDLEIIDVKDLDVPNEVKAQGAFFQAIACPKCKKSVFLGFIASIALPSVESAQRPLVAKNDVEVDVIDLSQADDDIVLSNNEPAPKKVKKAKRKQRDDKKSTQKHTPNRLRRQQAQCTQCGKMFDVGVEGVGGFGTKCKKCLDALVRKFAP